MTDRRFHARRSVVLRLARLQRNADAKARLQSLIRWLVYPRARR